MAEDPILMSRCCLKKYYLRRGLLKSKINVKRNIFSEPNTEIKKIP